MDISTPPKYPLFPIVFMAVVLVIAAIMVVAVWGDDHGGPALVVPTSTPVPPSTVAATPAPTLRPTAAILTPSAAPAVPTATAPPTPGSGAGSVVTFYICSGAPAGFEDGFCGTMANGETVHDGAVACGYAYHLGDQIRIVGDPLDRIYTCKDRGLLGRTQIDVFFWTYEAGRTWRNFLPLYPIVERAQ